MTDEATVRARLSHVLWIGGATDAGKTTIARLMAQARGWPIYHYDRSDLRHHQRLAETDPAYAAWIAASLDERWLDAAPADLAARAWRSFEDRFAFVIEELDALTCPPGVHLIAEGFGLIPKLVAPLLCRPEQAVWLLPSPGFKRDSMRRRAKGTFGGDISDPAKAAANLLERDDLLAERMRRSAQAHRLTTIEVDGTMGCEAMASRIAAMLTP